MDYTDLNLTPQLNSVDSLVNKNTEQLKEYVDEKVNDIVRPGGLSYYQTGLGREYQAVVSTNTSQGAFLSIQSAVNYLNSIGGGNLLVKEGTYYPTSGVRLYSNINLIGEGPRKTVIDGRNITDSSLGIIYADGVSNSAYGSSTLSSGSIIAHGNVGSAYNSYSGTTSFLTILDSSSQDEYLWLEIGSKTDGSTLQMVGTYQGNSISNEKHGLVRPVYNVSIQGLSVTNGTFSGLDGVHVTEGRNIKIDNIESSNCGDEGIQIYIGDSVSITNSIVNYNLGDGLRVDQTSNFTVRGIKSENNGGIGIDLVNSFGAKVSDCTSSNNYDKGIALLNATGCLCYGNYSVKNRTAGITVNTDSAKNIIVGNTVNKNGGIGVDNYSDYCLISNNTIFDNDGFGVNLETQSGTCHVVNNVLINNNGQLSNSGTGNTVSSNVGYITESSGLGTLPSGTTSVSINHGLSLTPNNVVCTTNTVWGSMVNFYIDSLGTGSFTFRSNTDPGTNVIFYWQAQGD